MAERIRRQTLNSIISNSLLTESWEVFETQWKNYLILAEAGCMVKLNIRDGHASYCCIGHDGLSLIEKIVDLRLSEQGAFPVLNLAQRS